LKVVEAKDTISEYEGKTINYLKKYAPKGADKDLIAYLNQQNLSLEEKVNMLNFKPKNKIELNLIINDFENKIEEKSMKNIFEKFK